ncbi:TonB-dependent receptor [Aquimarina sp. TRL1]|uniref:TonB-dependent receptor n=1 Tax=Aquimarina sp. (strain TRL1) TaxID=2736252 RepID=UPI0020CAFC08|nr:TonB-dependent receptor [Aquimarina sp. TRL1]
MKKFYIAGIAMLLLCISMHGQQVYTIEGKILNKETKKPIADVTVKLHNQYHVSDIHGNFRFKEIIEGQYILECSHVGYKTEKQSIDISKNTVLKIEMETISEILDNVLITGKTEKRKRKEIPMVSTVVDEEFLKSNRENSLMKTLEKIPGVSTISIGTGMSKPVIRGLGFNRVVVVQNGIKHEAQQWGSDHGLEIDQYGINAVEVIKGPASLLYGSDAIAGVVNILPPPILKKNELQGEISLLAQTNTNLLGGSIGLQKRYDHWYYGGRFTYRDYGDYKVPTDRIYYENYIFELQDQYLRNTAGVEKNASFITGYVSDRLTSSLMISNVNAKNGFFANAHGLEVRTSSIDYDQSNRDIDLPYHSVNHLKITNNTLFHGEHIDIEIEAGFQHNDREEHSEPVPHGYMPKPPATLERKFMKNTYSLNWRGYTKHIDVHKIHIGTNLEYQNNNIGGWGFLIPEYDRFSIGAYAYDQYQIHNNLHLQAGIRYDYGTLKTKEYFDWYQSPITDETGVQTQVNLQRAFKKNKTYGNFSGSLGLSYLHKKMTYKINIGKSFRMPLANELASDGVNYHMYRYEKGNIDLSAEEAYQLDVSIEREHNNYQLTISPFVNYFNNYIYLNPTSEYYETLQIYEYTQSEVFRMGGEVSVSVEPLPNITLDISGAYVFSRQMSGAKKDFTLPFSPPLSGMLTASYQFKDTRLVKKSVLQTAFKIAASQDEIVPPEEKTAGYQRVDLSWSSSFQFFRKYDPISISLKINNVFNTRYFDHTSFYRLIDVPEPGRNVSVSINLPINNTNK